MVVFTIPFPARGQGRPRFNRHTGSVYKDNVDTKYEDDIKAVYLEKFGYSYDYTGPIALTVHALYTKPKSWSKKRAAMELYKLSKPDLSNIVKSIEDALNKVAYADDSQIIEHHATKSWGKINEIVVAIERLA